MNHILSLLSTLQDECVNGVYVQHIVPNAPPERIMGRNLDTGQFLPMNGDNADLFYWTPTIWLNGWMNE